MEDAIRSILSRVDFVPRCGNPGSLVVFEQNAYPILSSEEDANSVIFAAAEVGQGRIFITSHEAFIENFTKSAKDFGQLWSNIKKWLLKGELLNDSEIFNIENVQNISEIPAKCRLLKWLGAQNKSDLFLNQLLRDYLSAGGAIICGVCPWGTFFLYHFKNQFFDYFNQKNGLFKKNL